MFRLGPAKPDTACIREARGPAKAGHYVRGPGPAGAAVIVAPRTRRLRSNAEHANPIQTSAPTTLMAPPIQTLVGCSRNRTTCDPGGTATPTIVWFTRTMPTSTSSTDARHHGWYTSLVQAGTGHPTVRDTFVGQIAPPPCSVPVARGREIAPAGRRLRRARHRRARTRRDRPAGARYGSQRAPRPA